MRRKFLEEIGAGELILDATDKREKKCREYEQKYGVYPPECWSLNYHMLEYLYERLIQYLKDADGFIDLEYHKFDFEGKEYNQKELINEMIEIAEFLLMDLNKVPKRSKAYKRLINNKYYIKYGKFNDFNQEQCEVRDRFWKIWAEIYPFMWW